MQRAIADWQQMEHPGLRCRDQRTARNGRLQGDGRVSGRLQRISRLDGDGYALFPAAETVLGLGDEQFAEVGLTFKRRPLRAAAETYLKHGPRWRELPPDALARDLQQVPRIGAWTAGAAVADFLNDFTHYPYADLAVRTWAKRAAPSYRWPDDEQSFGQLWRALAGDHLASLTLLTLAWGSHHGNTV
jgi:DNA-3-methyladenine glycosylase II